MANPFESWIDGAPVVQSGNTDSGDFAKWIDGRPVLETVGAKTTFLTPQTGALTADGQQVYLRPARPQTGALAVTGQPVRLSIGITPQTGALGLQGQDVGGTPSLSTIVSAEYTGDGASPRTFESFGTVPLVVLVIGKDGSGNVVGAIKTADMPSGVSQPLLTNQSAAASTRANRILDFTTNGFTVGDDLNVSGRKYAYVIFPKGRDTVVTAGSFVAPGGKPTVNSGVFVPSGAGVISGTSCFTATGDEAGGWSRPAGNVPYSTGVELITGGRRMIRNSDGAVLCEVTAAIDANSAVGVGYIPGLIAGTQWHWEEYYVDLKGQVCDMVVLMAGDATGSPGLPLTVVKPSEMSSVNADWAAVGYGELDVFLASDSDTALHVGTRDAGGGPALTKGVTYYYFSLHDDEANTGVPLHTFTWTGTGALGTPPTLAGMDFAPDWALVFAGNVFTWSKNTSNILGSNLRERLVLDGAGDSFNDALASWDSGGVTLTANGDWNGNGGKYIGVFFKADPVVAAVRPDAGALALTGQQPTVQVTTPPTTITPNTGELHITGKQPTVTPTHVRITPQTGSLIITPRNPVRATKRPVTPKTGSLRITGKAARTKESKGHKIPIDTADDPPSGGLQIFGTQPVLKTSIVPGTGALSATGQHCFVRPPEFPIIPQTGALSVDGQAARRVVTVTPGTGALVADGRAAILHQSFPTRITVDTGELGIQGKQPVLDTALIPVTGELSVATFDTEPILEREVTTTEITPRAGDLSISGVSPATNPALETSLTPQTGALNIVGQPAFTGGAIIAITPGTGALNFIGYQPVVQAPSPAPPPLPLFGQAGGAAMPSPRKLPYWPGARRCVASAEVFAAPGRVDVRARAEESVLELLSVLDTA